MHAELQIGDSRFFVNDTMSKSMPDGPEPGASNPMYLHVYVADVDTTFNRAVEGGARVDMPLQDMFWGDRYGKLTDPFGSNGYRHAQGRCGPGRDEAPAGCVLRQGCGAKLGAT